MVGTGADRPARTPFPAIVGQQEVKRVLLAVAVDDDLDGALLTGEKGTAKSTAVRALVDLLPDQRAVADCPYGCPPADPGGQCEDCRRRRQSGETLPVESRPVPMVTLPLGATRDRVVGTLSVADALAGEADFEPGLLARANRGFLYVDEINLLEDHLVDVVLDAAASGQNAVERDGVSVSHPADVTLIGTMNPEEGELRPQLRDRFALRATVTGCEALDDRVEIIDRALASCGDEDTAEYADELDRLRERLRRARGQLERVELDRDRRREIATLCRDVGVDGHRGDIATARAARALAALDGRRSVGASDLQEAARYALGHRLRSRPFDDAPSVEELLDDRFETDCGGDSAGGPDERGPGERTDSPPGDDDSAGSGSTEDPDSQPGDSGRDGPGDDDRSRAPGSAASGDTADPSVTDATGDAVRSGDSPADAGANQAAEGTRLGESESTGGDGVVGDGRENEASPGVGGPDGSDVSYSADDSTESGESNENGEEATPLVPGSERAGIGTARAPAIDDPTVEPDGESARSGRLPTTGHGDRGVRVRTERARPTESVDAAASVRAAATRGSDRVEGEDLRRSIRETPVAATVVFVLDASASMRPAMRAAKGVVLELLRESYRQRDEVAVIAFAGERAEVLCPPTGSVTLAARHLKELPTGDRTPLPAGLDAATELLDRERPAAAVVVCVTDGRATVADGSPTARTREAARALSTTDASVLVVDADPDSRTGLTELIATETDGECVPLSGLTADRVRGAADAAATDSRPAQDR